MIDVTDARLDAAGIREELLDPGAGAVVVFEGCARDNHQGRSVDLLAYEAFTPMALQELARIRGEAMERFGLIRCVIHHRTGEVPLLEAAVVVGVSSGHRKEAFEAVAWIMDRIKESVPIWKRENYRDGEKAWVEGENRQ
ncbi:molybdenum cofactor biosynthesis protein MoaE [Mesoterricola silvestris]|uniref:Molybdopterin synthase catalytic subunit n=1 Tax=Mesoterricola silvestris TaxID=2927979 RepID=A0AA48KCH8_9BACT|nr:molybdenum cofactor biosynthesis protein MoaE [Mesoterricola silvestris]BDU73523.1 molybdenum cofactor biosynthesis protein MoaE [Mesoterricola silvestris]